MRLLRGTAALVALVFAGCSSSVLTGGKGGELDNIGNGNFNKACLGIDLSNEALNPSAARALVNCLNSNGSIQAYADLVRSMNDAQLKTVLDVANSEIMTNHSRMKELDRSFQQMDERGIIDRSFRSLSTILANAKMIRSGLKLLRQTGGTVDASGVFHLDPAIVRSFHVLADEVSTDAEGNTSNDIVRSNLKRGLEQGVVMTSLKSYKGIVGGLRSAIEPRFGGLGLLTNLGVEYVKAKIRSPRPYAKVLLWGIEDGTLLHGFDYYYGNECEHLPPSQCAGEAKLETDAQVQAMESFLRLLNIDHREDILKPTVDLFRVMDGPIECMAGSKQVPNADMYVMNELIKRPALDVPHWTMRPNFLKLTVADSMCSYPQGSDGSSFNQLIDVLRRLADYPESNDVGATIHRRPLITVSNFLKGLEIGDKLAMSDAARADLAPFFDYPENERYRRFMISWLGDKDTAVNVYTHLSSALAELTRKERSVMGNTLYLLNTPSPGSIDRKNIQAIVRALLKTHPELAAAAEATSLSPGTNSTQQRSVYDVLSKAVLGAESSTVYELLLSMSTFLDSPEEILYPLISSSRDALLMNNVNPLADVILNVAKNSEKNAVFFDTLFAIADTSEFERAMTLTSRMAANKTLKELIQGVFAIFRSSTKLVPGNGPLLATVSESRIADPLRDKSTVGRLAWEPARSFWPTGPSAESGMQACHDLNLDVKLSEPFAASQEKRSLWNRLLRDIGSCANANDQNPELVKLVDYSLREKVDAENDKSLAGFLIDFAAGLIPGSGPELWIKNIYDEFSDVMTDDVKFRDLKAMNDMMPFMLGKNYCSLYDKKHPEVACPAGSESISVLQGLSRSFAALLPVSDQLQEILSFAKTPVEDERLPKSVALLYDAVTDADHSTRRIEADRKPPIKSYPLSAYPNNDALAQSLDDAIRRVEKTAPTEKRRQEIIDDYQYQPLPGEQHYYTGPDGKQRIGFQNSAQFKARLKPLLDEISRDNRIDWLLYFFAYMDGNPYTPEWWADWFRRNAADVRPIAYTYAGDKSPRVRLVSMLDILDMIVLESDFTLRGNGELTGLDLQGMDENTSIEYLTQIANSSTNNELTDVIQRMNMDIDLFYRLSKSFLGVMLKDETKRRLSNLRNIHPFFRDINRVREFTGSDGKKIVANDLGVLRDLFKTVLSATPRGQGKDPYDPDTYDPAHTTRGRAKQTTPLYRRDYNSLAVVTELTGMGALHTIGSLAWYFDGHNVLSNRMAHVFKLLMEASIVKRDGQYYVNEVTKSMLVHLLKQDCRRDLAKYKDGCVGKDPKESFDERYVFVGRLIDQFFEWMKDDDAKELRGQPTVKMLAKRGGYDLVSLLDRLSGGFDSKYTWNLVKATQPLLGTPKGTDVLGRNLDIADSLLTDPKTVRVLDGLLAAEGSLFKHPDSDFSDGEAFEDLKGLARKTIESAADNDARVSRVGIDVLARLYDDAANRWRQAMHTVDAMQDDADYKDFKDNTGERVLGELVHWFAKQGTPQQSRDLAPRIQHYLGQRLGDRSVLQLTQFIGNQSGENKPDVFYSNMKFLGDRSYVNKLNDFMDDLRNGIVDVYQVPAQVRNRQATR